MIQLTAIHPPTYSYGMISEFQDLSDKITKLAELTDTLRRENASLRHANAILTKENEDYARRVAEAHHRVMVLLQHMPPEAGAVAAAALAATVEPAAQPEPYIEPPVESDTEPQHGGVQ